LVLESIKTKDVDENELETMDSENEANLPNDDDNIDR
jgi:hypothetical protein